MSYDIKGRQLGIEVVQADNVTEFATALQTFLDRNFTIIDMQFSQRRAMKANDKDGTFVCIVIYKK